MNWPSEPKTANLQSETGGHTRLPPFQIEVNSGTFAAREAISLLKDKLAPLELDIEESGTIELVIAEVMNNVVEHGYSSSTIGGPINIDCSHEPNGLHICVVDQGVPMPNGETPLGLAKNVDVDFMDTPEGGFGWFLINDLAKDVLYERQDDKNYLRMRVAIALSPVMGCA